jgi:hypothetical protein
VILRGADEARFVEQADRGQWTLLPECLDDFIDESNPVRVIDVFVDALDLDLAEISIEGVEPAATGWPSYMCSVRRTLPRDGPPRDGERCHRWQQVQDPERTLLDHNRATIMIATTMNAATSERARSRIFDPGFAISSSGGTT